MSNSPSSSRRRNSITTDGIHRTAVGPLAYEYEFFKSSFQLIDKLENRTRQQRTAAVFERLAATAGPEGRINDWNHIPISGITSPGFPGYRQAIEQVISLLMSYFKTRPDLRCQIDAIISQANNIIKHRGSLNGGNLDAGHENARKLWEEQVDRFNTMRLNY